jgi:hypothetical protein
VPPEEPRCEIGRHCPSYDSAPPGHTHEGLTPAQMLWGEHQVPAAPPEHVCQTGAALITSAWIVEALLALENRSEDKRRGLCRRREVQGGDLAGGEGQEAGADPGSGGALTSEGGEDGIAATDVRVTLPVPSNNIPMTRDPDPTFNRAGRRQSFVLST